MIDKKEKNNCCGCGACVQICPKQCISMAADNEGFLYPQVNSAICIDCGLCEKVCPVINQSAPREPLVVYAAKNNNEDIRLKSSSGGIFTLLAEKVIEEGGVVFGAKFDADWNVIHDYTETIEGLAAFRGSKYVQSIIDDNFKTAKQFLNNGRKVLFSGTPCQIAGLKKYLRKEYDNLLVVRTFSKSRNLAGGRIGWAVGSKELITDLNTVKYSFNPYNVNSMSQCAAICALKDKQYFEQCVSAVKQAREYTQNSLKELGFTVIDSSANFIFAAPPSKDGKREQFKRTALFVYL